MITRLKKLISRIDAKIISTLSSEVKQEVLMNTKKINFTAAKTKISLLEAIDTYDSEVLSYISRRESKNKLSFVLTGYVKFKKATKPWLKKGLRVARRIKAKIL